MSDIVSQIMSSAKVISAPSGDAAKVDSSPTTQEDVRVPIVADSLGLGIFFGENSPEIVSPEMLYGIKSKVNAISSYVRDNIKTPSEDSVKNFIAKLSSENNWDNLKPTEKLEKFYDYVDLKRRLQERKRIDSIIKELKSNLNA